MSTNIQTDQFGPVYQAQARIITELRDQMACKDDEIIKLKSQYANAIFYKHITNAVRNHEHLRDSWISFVALLRLSEPDLEDQARKEIENTTSFEYRP